MNQSTTVPADTALADSAVRALDALLQETGEAGDRETSPAPAVGDGVAGVVELWGAATGVACVVFPRATAERIVELATGKPAAFGTPGFEDAIAELTEMIVVGARDAIGGADTGASRACLVFDAPIQAPPSGVGRSIWTECGSFRVWASIDYSGGRS